MEVLDNTTKAAKIRSYVRAGGFSTRDIAALCDTSVRVVNAVKKRALAPVHNRDLAISIARILERVRTLELKIARLEAKD